MKYHLIFLLTALLPASCQQKQTNDAGTVSQSFDQLNAVNTDKEIACKLTTPELASRIRAFHLAGNIRSGRC